MGLGSLLERLGNPGARDPRYLEQVLVHSRQRFELMTWMRLAFVAHHCAGDSAAADAAALAAMPPANDGADLDWEPLFEWCVLLGIPGVVGLLHGGGSSGGGRSSSSSGVAADGDDVSGAAMRRYEAARAARRLLRGELVCAEAGRCRVLEQLAEALLLTGCHPRRSNSSSSSSSSSGGGGGGGGGGDGAVGTESAMDVESVAGDAGDAAGTGGQGLVASGAAAVEEQTGVGVADDLQLTRLAGCVAEHQAGLFTPSCPPELIASATDATASNAAVDGVCGGGRGGEEDAAWRAAAQQAAGGSTAAEEEERTTVAGGAATTGPGVLEALRAEVAALREELHAGELSALRGQLEEAAEAAETSAAAAAAGASGGGAGAGSAGGAPDYSSVQHEQELLAALHGMASAAARAGAAPLLPLAARARLRASRLRDASLSLGRAVGALHAVAPDARGWLGSVARVHECAARSGAHSFAVGGAGGAGGAAAAGCGWSDDAIAAVEKSFAVLQASHTRRQLQPLVA